MVVLGEDLKARLMADRYVALLIDPDSAETAVLESAVPISFPDGWMVARERRYGGTLVTVAHRSGTSS